MAQPVLSLMPPHTLSKHSRHRVPPALLLVWLTLALGVSVRADQIPTPQQVAAQAKTTGYVTDLAGALRPEGRAKIEALCTELSQKAAAKIAVITVKSTGDETAQQYSFDV